MTKTLIPLGLVCAPLVLECSRIVLEHSRFVDLVPEFSWEEEKEASTWASAKLLVWITGRGGTLGVDFSGSQNSNSAIDFGKPLFVS